MIRDIWWGYSGIVYLIVDWIVSYLLFEGLDVIDRLDGGDRSSTLRFLWFLSDNIIGVGSIGSDREYDQIATVVS